MNPEDAYVIRYQGLYWRPDGAGYTDSLLEAGLYPAEEALRYERNRRGDHALPFVPLLEVFLKRQFNREVLALFFQRMGPVPVPAVDQEAAEARAVLGLSPWPEASNGG